MRLKVITEAFISILLLAVGFMLGIASSFYWHLDAVPAQAASIDGYGERIKVAQYWNEKRVLWGSLKNYLLIEFMANGKGRPSIRIKEKPESINLPFIIGGNEKMVVLETGMHKLLGFGRVNGSVRRLHLSSLERFITLLPDDNLLTYDDDKRLLSKKDWSGNVKKSIASDLRPGMYGLSQNGILFAFLTSDYEGDFLVSHLFLWDLNKNKLIEDVRPEVVRILRNGDDMRLLVHENEPNAIYLGSEGGVTIKLQI